MEFTNIGTDFTAYVGMEHQVEGQKQPATLLLFSNQNNLKVTIDATGISVEKGSRQWFDSQIGFAQGIGRPHDTSGNTSDVDLDLPQVGGDPNDTGRPKGEAPPPDMTGGGVPIRGGKPGKAIKSGRGGK
jgi:hypothetical protein